MAPVRAVTSGRAVQSLVLALALVASALATGAGPAAAASAPPWRFTSVAFIVDVTSAPASHNLTCPNGFRPVWGGVVEGDINVRRYEEWIDPASNTYHIGLMHRVAGVREVTVRAHCVWADDLGPIEKVTIDFPRHSSSGFGGGTLNCPVGYEVLSGGADWNTADSADGRHLTYSAPVLDDGSRPVAWYMAGYSPTAGDELTVEAYCIQASYLATGYATVDISDPSPGHYATMGATAVCLGGYRMLTGGSYPWGTPQPTYQYQGWGWIDGPTGPQYWQADAILPYEAQIRSVGICIPASTPSVELTQTPPLLSNQRTGQISWSASDQKGESLHATCELDGDEHFCPPTATESYTGLDDGLHLFTVRVTNVSGGFAYADHQWSVDATAPTVASHPSGSVGVASPMAITFSEAVSGANAGAIEVHGQATNVDVPGTVSRPSQKTMVWTPMRPLMPGETYRVSLSNTIKDKAGNNLTPTFWDVRAAGIVQNSSPALVEAWDVDARPVASNDVSIVSRTKGSAASLTFSAQAGQVVSVFGVRLPDGGFADVFLDGVKKATPSFYAPTVSRAKVYASAALSAGQHTLSIRPTGTRPAASSGMWVGLDDLTVGSAVRQESALRQTFARARTANASGGSYDVATHVTDNDAAPAFSARFVGDGVKVFATKTPASGRARVFVDGVLKRTIDLHAASAVFKALVYSTALPQGVHRIRVEPVGTATGSSSAVGFDYLVIT